MKPDTIEEQFENLRGLSAADQSAAVGRLYPENDNRHGQLLKLLAADRRMGEFLQRPIVSPDVAIDASSPHPPELPGIEIIRTLGTGGMSRVFLGEMPSLSSTRQVAVKQLHAHFWGTAVATRFRQEAEVLAHLNHPNVARLYQALDDRHGVPCLVMEYVDGSNLLDHCHREQLDLEQRLHLLLAVIDGVGHAHDNLIVHRDIKPENVLVDRQGTPRVVDFGIARRLDVPGETMDGIAPMTPDYASPEQRSGVDPDIRSDIWSIGVLMFELLAGVHPLKFGPGSQQLGPSDAVLRGHRQLDDHCKAIGMSRAVLKRRLRGDLDAIVMQCCQIDPGHRYRNCSALAADLKAAMEHRPTQAAKRLPVGRRLQKFLQRQRAAVGVVAMVVVISLVAVGLEWQRAAMLESERSRARAVTDFLIDLFDAGKLGEQGMDRDSVRGLLDRAAIDLKEADEQALSTSDSLLRAEQLYAIGRGYHELEFYQDAQRHLDRAYALIADESMPALAVPIGRLLAESLNNNGNTRRAKEIATATMELAARDLGPDTLETRRSLISGSYYLEPEQALKTLNAMDAGVDRELQMERTLAIGWRNLQLGNLSAASSALETVNAQLRSVEGADANIVLYSLLLAAEQYRASGRYDLAIEAFDELLAETDRRLGSIGWRWRWRGVLGKAMVLQAIEQPRAALAVLESGQEFLEDLSNPIHPSRLAMMELRAVLHSAMGRPSLAAPIYENLIGLDREHDVGDKARVSAWWQAYGVQLEGLRQIPRAEQAIRVALDHVEDQPPSYKHWQLYFDFAGILAAGGQYDEARVYYDRSVALLRAEVEGDSLLIAGVLKEATEIPLREGRLGDAEAMIAEAVHIFETRLGPNDVRTALSYLKWARINARQDQWLATRDRAIAAQQVFARAAAEQPLAAWALPRAHLILAQAHLQLGKPAAAAAVLNDAPPLAFREYGLENLAMRLWADIEES